MEVHRSAVYVAVVLSQSAQLFIGEFGGRLVAQVDVSVADVCDGSPSKVFHEDEPNDVVKGFLAARSLSLDSVDTLIWKLDGQSSRHITVMPDKRAPT